MLVCTYVRCMMNVAVESIPSLSTAVIGFDASDTIPYGLSLAGIVIMAWLFSISIRPLVAVCNVTVII